MIAFALVKSFRFFQQVSNESLVMCFQLINSLFGGITIAFCNMIPISTNALVVPDKADKTTIVGSVFFVTSDTIWCIRSGLPHWSTKLHYFHFCSPPDIFIKDLNLAKISVAIR